MRSFQIRPILSSDDRMTLSRVYEESWKSAYQGILPQDYLDTIPTGFWVDKIDQPQRQTLVGLFQEKFAGVCAFGPARQPVGEEWAEIYSLYLLPPYQRQGLGRELLKTAVNILTTQEYDRIFLWVLEENHPARCFYEHAGFSATSCFSPCTIGGKKLLQMLYVYPPHCSPPSSLIS